MAQVPPMGMGYGYQIPPGIPPYPGPPQINNMPQLQVGPYFDGMHDRNPLPFSPYFNSMQWDLDTLQDQIYGMNGLGGGLPGMQYAPPMFGPMPTPMPLAPNAMPPIMGSAPPSGTGGSTGGSSGSHGG